ncbi:lymphotoxin-alpha [Discoglossus pictus]
MGQQEASLLSPITESSLILVEEPKNAFDALCHCFLFYSNLASFSSVSEMETREAKDPHKATNEQGIHMKLKNSNRKPAAHFEADPYKTHSLIWSNDTNNGFIRGGLILVNNTLHISHDGLYFVYTQATFMASGCPQGEPIYLSHEVSLWSGQHSDQIQLLSAQKTACGEQASVRSRHSKAGLLSRLQHRGSGIVEPVWSRTIFQGGVFALEKGDRLFTVTEGAAYLTLGPGEAYFGIYAL